MPLCNGRHKIACPPYYYAQVQYGMQLFKMSGVDLPRAHFVVWVGGAGGGRKTSGAVDDCSTGRATREHRSAVLLQLSPFRPAPRPLVAACPH